jgi:hypothetical protein
MAEKKETKKPSIKEKIFSKLESKEKLPEREIYCSRKSMYNNLDNEIKDTTQEDEISHNALKLEVQEMQILLNEMRMENQAMHTRLHAVEQYLGAVIESQNKEEQMAGAAMPQVKEEDIKKKQ